MGHFCTGNLNQSQWKIIHEKCGLKIIARLRVTAVFLASAFNYFAYAWAARRSTASHVTAFFPLQVVFTAILQIIFLHVPPTPAQLGGAAMIVLALFCIVASLAYESKADTESPKVLVEESAHDGPSESDLPSPARAF